MVVKDCRKYLYWVIVCGACFYAEKANAQQHPDADTVFFLAHKKGLLGKIGKSLSVNIPEQVLTAGGAIKNEAAFTPFRGRIIRNINIRNVDFSHSVNDTTLEVDNIFSTAGNKIHPHTREKVIRRNLFFTSGDTLYPALLADNERYLRDLSFLQDAKIRVTAIPGQPDSVDLTIFTKDVFPAGGSVDEGSEKMASFELNDDNLLGSGDRIQVRNLFDADRKPKYGFGLEYVKRNLGGSFLNLTGGYRTEAPTFNNGARMEKDLYLLGDLPLPSPYHAWTGGFEIAHHATTNAYLSDSIYNANIRYSYRVFDGWIGYNIGARKQLQQNFKSRLKKVVALRAIHRTFEDVPTHYPEIFKSSYNNLVTVLGSFTLFEQDYYHTNFLYGFGRNEDVPEGFTLSFTGGWTNRNQISRPYLGFEYNRFYFSDNKDYFNYTLRMGAYYNQSRVQDISVLSSLDFFTRLRRLGNSRWYIRHFISGSLTQLSNTYLNDPLRLSSDYGIPQLNNPDLIATTRATFNAETVFYNTWKLAGFSFAPFAFANLTFLKPIGKYIESGDLYSAFGGGVRSRNENLVFGTMELKFYYYPRPVNTSNQWNVTLNTGLQFRYLSQLIKRPDFAVNN